MNYLKHLAPSAAALGIFGLSATSALAMQVDVLIDKVSQHMIVKVDGLTQYDWLVSTGAPGYDTPSGNFRIFRMEAEHFSKEWDDAPMPHSMFFTGWGHALHGSFHVKSLGRAASHGCVRLHPENAAILFSLVQKAGFKNSNVTVRGQTGFFQAPEPQLTTNDTFKLPQRPHGVALASLAPASTTENRPFWWQQPQPQAAETKAAPPKKVKLSKKEKAAKVKLAKKGKKGKQPEAPNFFEWLKQQQDS